MVQEIGNTFGSQYAGTQIIMYEVFTSDFLKIIFRIYSSDSFRVSMTMKMFGYLGIIAVPAHLCKVNYMYQSFECLG